MLLLVSSADGVADVVLTCTLVEEGAGLGGMGGGHFTRTPATLILRDVAVGPDESLEELTPFVPPSIPDPDLLLFEAKGFSLATSLCKVSSNVSTTL